MACRRVAIARKCGVGGRRLLQVGQGVLVRLRHAAGHQVGQHARALQHLHRQARAVQDRGQALDVEPAQQRSPRRSVAAGSASSCRASPACPRAPGAAPPRSGSPPPPTPRHPAAPRRPSRRPSPSGRPRPPAGRAPARGPPRPPGPARSSASLSPCDHHDPVGHARLARPPVQRGERVRVRLDDRHRAPGQREWHRQHAAAAAHVEHPGLVTRPPARGGHSTRAHCYGIRSHGTNPWAATVCRLMRPGCARPGHLPAPPVETNGRQWTALPIGDRHTRG